METHDRTLPPLAAESRPAGGWSEVASSRQLLALISMLWFFNVIICHPGTAPDDSLRQYQEALDGRYTDWHAPIMAWLWAHLRPFGEGAGPIFTLHLTFYWTGIGAIADGMRRLQHRNIALLVALAGAFPAFVFLNSQVIQDVAMASGLLAGAGLVFWFRSQGRRIPAPAACAIALLVAYGTLARTNAVFALGPVLLYAIAARRWLRTARLAAATLAIAIAAVPVTHAVNRVLFHPAERHPVDALMLYDIAGVAAERSEPMLLLPRALLDPDQLRQCYTPIWWEPFSAWGPCGRFVSRPGPDLPVDGTGLAAQWLRVVASHPGAYLEHRLKHFNSELMFMVPLGHMRFIAESARVPASQVRMDMVRKNPLVWPVTWLVWAGVLLAFLARLTPTTPVLFARVMAGSGLAYGAAYLFVGIATGMRYQYWPMLSAVMGTLVVAPELAKGWQSRPAVLRNGLALLALVMALGIAARVLDFQGWLQA